MDTSTSIRYGLDSYAINPNIAKEQGASFVLRYLYNLSRTEAEAHAALGIDVVAIWETTGTRALQGYQAGAEDARIARQRAAACGMVGNQPIMYTADFDDSAYATAVLPYWEGIYSEVGLAGSGAYGGIATIRTLFDHRLISIGWQTSAWSYGVWDPRAQIHQVEYDRYWDRDIAYGTYFGQWRPGHSQPPPTPAPFAVLTPLERQTLERYIDKGNAKNKRLRAQLKAQLQESLGAIYKAEKAAGFTKKSWTLHNREARYRLMSKYVSAPPVYIAKGPSGLLHRAAAKVIRAIQA